VKVEIASTGNNSRVVDQLVMSPEWLELSVMERVEESVLGPVVAAETVEVVMKEKMAC
jgi:hypothetical protein